MPDAGWYADEDDPTKARWHDGAVWTEHRVVMADHDSPPPPPVEPAAPVWTAPAAPAAPPPPSMAPPPPIADPGLPPIPPGPTPQQLKTAKKASRPVWKKKRFLIPAALVVLIGLGVALGGGKDDDNDGVVAGATTTTASDATTTTEATTTTKPARSLLPVGATDNTSGQDVTLLTVETPFKLDEYESEPDAGHRYIGVELKVVNTTSKEQTMSSLAQLSVRDATGQRFDITLAGLSRPQVDGTIAPGEAIRGWAVFDVPTDATGLYLHVIGSITASGIDFDLGAG